MGDPAFEGRLQRLYAEPSVFADGPAFVARIGARLERGWAFRRVLITAAGVLGGAVAAVQLAGAHLLRQADMVERSSAAELHQQLVHLGSLFKLPLGDMLGVPFGVGPVWMVAALVLLALGFLATRLIEEI